MDSILFPFIRLSIMYEEAKLSKKPITVEKTEKIKKKSKKKNQFNKKWFLVNFDKIYIEDILQEIEEPSRDPKVIYSTYLMSGKNKTFFNEDLYERVLNVYLEEITPKRTVIL